MITKNYTGVSTPNPGYEKNLPLWDRCIDASEGQYKIHEKNTAYLPRLRGEEQNDYETRLKRTTYFNATWRTISGLKGMVFRKPSNIVAPAGAERFLDNVDLAGTPLDVFVQGVFERVLQTGRSGILVDYPSIENANRLTVADAELLGLRPLMVHYTEKAIINWRTTRIAGSEVLTLVVLQEEAPMPQNEYSHETQTVFRVLDLTPAGYRQRLYQRVDNADNQVGEDLYPLMNNQPLRRIPFYFAGVDSISPTVSSPPLLDLVDMNLAHYMVTSDYEHACHFSGLPTLFLTGHRMEDGDPPITLGGTSANCLPDPMAKAFFVETTGDFPALRTNLEDKKSQMAVLGARMLESQKSAVESSETQRTRQSGEQSQLAAMAQVVNITITNALTTFLRWAGLTGDVAYTLNNDFVPIRMSAQELTALIGSWQSGAISSQTLFDNLQDGEIIAQGVTFEVEQERINSQRID
jgi:hypothetical protein